MDLERASQSRSSALEAESLGLGTKRNGATLLQLYQTLKVAAVRENMLGVGNGSVENRHFIEDLVRATSYCVKVSIRSWNCMPVITSA